MKYGCMAMVILLLLSLVGGGWYWYKQRNALPDWNLEEVDQGEIRQTISATGSLAAVTTVEVGCQISGILASISVDFNDNVKAGQVIAQLDSSTYEAQVEQATANLENAHAGERNSVAQIENLRASMLGAKADEQVGEANVRKAEVAVTDAERNYKRMKELAARKLISQSDLDSAETAFDSQKAALAGTRSQIATYRAKQEAITAQIAAAEAQHSGTLSQIRQMEALLNVSRINLGRTTICSPIDGVIVSRNVDVGQTVAASLQAPTLFTIANDLRHMQINTAVDEADIGKVKEGQPAFFTVDTFKGRTFKGRVEQVRLAPTISQNVVTYSVMVMVDNDDMVLKPGMTANVDILVEKKENVVRVPSRALFFKPPTAYMPANLPPFSEGSTQNARVWALSPASLPVPITIQTGISSTRYTEVIGDAVKPGQMLLVSDKASETAKNNRRSGGIRIH
ncbi:MAG TPA: efflux RND transporter periplasmic adaptor subunit [Candidatus Ozemobacteraceae bacterium]|nr:efflux RND transporter periplasmic adaptor subunit [Candidatus Ozemobacteraceae bacterium]